MGSTLKPTKGRLVGLLVALTLISVGLNSWSYVGGWLHDQEQTAYQRGVQDTLATFLNTAEQQGIVRIQADDRNMALVSVDSIIESAERAVESGNGVLTFSNGENRVNLVVQSQTQPQAAPSKGKSP